ncbi:hypothetical protein G2W53_002495 [Senna tora]|uniref:Uncharacterized protein n=1 Tax=Senna tora TaxID=362788 RepID=A0A834XHH0_9FABA|nr:hypothetical protein G2W53_002495 [Senna tora]
MAEEAWRVKSSAMKIGVRISDGEEVVWDAATFFFGDLVDGDVEAFVDLHFDRVDDLGGREASGEVGIVGAGGAHNDNDLVFAVVGEEKVHSEAHLKDEINFINAEFGIRRVEGEDSNMKIDKPQGQLWEMRDILEWMAIRDIGVIREKDKENRRERKGKMIQKGGSSDKRKGEEQKAKAIENKPVNVMTE